MPENSQVDQNYIAFTAILPSIAVNHGGEFALMKDSEIIEFFDTARDAYVAGKRLYGEGNFSVQEVVEVPVDLGFFSHALPKR